MELKRHDDRAHFLVVLARCFAFGAVIASACMALFSGYKFFVGDSAAFEYLRHAGILLGVVFIAVIIEETLKKHGFR